MEQVSSLLYRHVRAWAGSCKDGEDLGGWQATGTLGGEMEEG